MLSFFAVFLFLLFELARGACPTENMLPSPLSRNVSGSGFFPFTSLFSLLNSGRYVLMFEMDRSRTTIESMDRIEDIIGGVRMEQRSLKRWTSK
jgi:hypothetical protein